MNRYFIVAVSFSLLLSQSIFGQDSIPQKKVKILPVPTFGYSPETRTYIGVVSLFTFDLYTDSTTRLSNAKVEFSYTWNKQMIMDGAWNHFSKNEEWFTKGQLHYSEYPDFYYGIGSTTPEFNKLTYNSNRFIFEVYALKKIQRYLFTGLNLKYVTYWNVEPTEISTLNYPELVNRSAYGIGYSVLKDSRNNLLTPTKGIYAYANTTYNFSTTNYLEVMLDLRYYKTWNDKFILAVRFINDLNTGTPPFFDYALMGGDKFVRGYYLGRYRDKHLSSLQLEFRLPVIGRFGLATFGGVSNVYPDAPGSKVQDTKYNGGLGLRWMVDKKDRTNLRIDYAIGNDRNSGFYVSFGESF